METIGDAYMVVGGLPDRRKDHAEAIAMFALEMINEAAHVRRTVMSCHVLCCGVLRCAVVCCGVLYCAVLCCTVLSASEMHIPWS